MIDECVLLVGENHTAVVDSEKQRWNAFVTTSFHSSVVYYPSVCDSLDTVHLLVYSKSPPLKHRRNEVGISRSIVEVGVTTPVIVVNTDSGSNHASFPTDQDAITFSKAGHRDCLDHEYTVVTTVVYQGGGGIAGKNESATDSSNGGKQISSLKTNFMLSSALLYG